MSAFEGLELKKVTASEYAGACPFCGGEDRFRVWPESGKSGRWWCRGCEHKGDGIALLMELHSLSFKDACNRLNLDVKRRSVGWINRSPFRQIWRPKPTNFPPSAWQKKAAEIVDQATARLKQNQDAMQWLINERGLTPETIEAARLGWTSRDRYFDRESWGLPAEIKPNGKKKKLWLPAGLLIPCLAGDGSVSRLRVRRSDPGDGQRYIVVSGGYGGPTGWNIDRPTVLIVESELDGLLCRQEAPPDVGVVALGSAQIKPTSGLGSILTGKRLLVALDADEAGDKAAEWWLKQYPTAIRLRPTKKDPGDMLQAGQNIKSWINGC